MSDAHISDNKQLRFYDANGNYTRHSVDEAIALKLNHWKGWNCSAGYNGLYIDYDGNLFVGNCASSERNKEAHSKIWKDFYDKRWAEEIVNLYGPEPHRDWRIANWHKISNQPIPSGEDFFTISEPYLQKQISQEQAKFNLKLTKEFNQGGSSFAWKSKPEDVGKVWGLLGNIYNNFDIPRTWTKCPFNSCGCGQDVVLPKAKQNKDIKNLHVLQDGWNGKVNSSFLYKDKIESPVAMEMNFPVDYQILWDISRRCNYNCSYCWPSVHNSTDPHHDFDIVMKTIDRLINEWANGETIRWSFGGGEPTLHPKCKNILEHLKSKNQWTMLTTNGSRTNRWWQDARKLINTCNFSCHFEAVDEDLFLANVNTVLEWHDESDDDLWCEVKLMAPTGVVDRALELMKRVKDLPSYNRKGANGRSKGTASIVPIRSLEDAGRLTEYTDKELRILQEQ